MKAWNRKHKPKFTTKVKNRYIIELDEYVSYSRIVNEKAKFYRIYEVSDKNDRFYKFIDFKIITKKEYEYEIIENLVSKEIINVEM